jgi:hypothetical protein
LTILLGISKELLKDFKAELRSPVPLLGRAFLQHVEFLKVYSVFCANQTKAYSMLENICSEWPTSGGSTIFNSNLVGFRSWLVQKFGSFSAAQFVFRR